MTDITRDVVVIGAGADLRAVVGPIHFARSDMAGAGYQHVDGGIRMGRLAAANILEEEKENA